MLSLRPPQLIVVGCSGSLHRSAPEVKAVALPPRAFYPALAPGLRATLIKEREAAIVQAEIEAKTARDEAAKTLPGLQAQLAKARAELEKARAEGKAGPSLALAGKQSLLFDATTGRRALHNNLSGLTKLEEGTVIRFELRILKDAHFNFQLLRDLGKGLTAGYVAFDKGRILSYRPGSFTEFEAGRYDLGSGDDRFELVLIIEPKADRCLVSVKARKSGKILTERTPVALNGWNPVGNPAQPIFLDAHAGSVALVDDLAVLAPAGAPLIRFDFEAPKYVEGRDIVGIDGWGTSSFSLPPATSMLPVRPIRHNTARLAWNALRPM